MIQAVYPAQFEREMGCTEAELLGWLPGAVGGRDFTLAEGCARVPLEGGQLALCWKPLPPRVIALMRMPRLWVSFSFEGVSPGLRHDFMKYFDLYTQRGGG